MSEILEIEEREDKYSLKKLTPIYNLIKPGQDDFYNVDDFNANTDVIEGELKKHADQIKNLSDPYVIGEGEDIPVSQRVKGKIYFKVTSRQSGGINSELKVSPNMSIKIQE